MAGVGGASLAWQLALAAIGAALGRTIGPRGRLALSSVGFGVIALLAGLVFFH